MGQLIILLTRVRMSGRVVKWNHHVGYEKTATVGEKKKIGNDGNTGRETKQTEIGDGRDENIFPLCLVWYITFWFYVFSEVCWEPYVQLLETQQLTPLQQNNIQPTSHLDTTWQILRNCWGGGVSDCGAGGLGLVKMCTVDCYHDETFCKNSTMAGNNKHKMALDKYCNSKWIQRLIFLCVKLLRGYGDCCHPQGQMLVTLYYHIKT